jgi:anti-anti-sigma regulatory factor
MNINVIHHEGKVSVIEVDGRLDGSSFEAVITKAREIKAEGAASFLLDLSKCSFLSSAGLMALHSVALIARGEQPLDTDHGWGAFRQMDADKASGAQNKFVLVGPSDKIKQTLEMTGMLIEFDIFDDLASALASFAG